MIMMLRRRHMSMALFPECRLDGHGRGIVRIVEDQQSWACGYSPSMVRSMRSRKRLIIAQRHADHIGAGHGDGVNVNRESRIADDDRVARAQHAPGRDG